MSDPPALPGRVLGLDIGTHRIGVAISDELGIVAVPDRVILVPQTGTGEGEAITAIVAYVRDRAVVRVVAGLPRNMRGERGVQATWTQRVVDALRAALIELHIPVVTSDERLTTSLAERFEHDQDREHRRGEQDARWSDPIANRFGRDRGRGQKQGTMKTRQRGGGGRENREDVDARAAAVILQGYLDRQRARTAREIDGNSHPA